MKKAEMEAHRADYDDLMRKAVSAEREALYSQAVKLALSSWEHIDGMMRYKNRYSDAEFSSIKAIDLVLKYAPYLFDFRSLDKLEALLKGCRRIETKTSDSMAEKLKAARAFMWGAHRLWDHIERNPNTRQDKLRQRLGGEQDVWRSIADTWEKMGLLTRTPESGSYRLALATRMGGVVNAKCPSCGNVVSAPKAMLLEKSDCPECRKSVLFVILVGTGAATEKG